MSRATRGVRRAFTVGTGFLLVLLPLLTYGLGLGPIKVKSALNENLNAEIEFTSVTDQELKDLQIGLAPVVAFQAVGIERTPQLRAISFRVARHADGRPYLHLTTKSPYTEPYLHLLLQAEWRVGASVGRLRREYTALIDPPFLTASRPDGIEAPAPAARVEPEPGVKLEEPAPASKTPEPEPQLLLEPEPAPKETVSKTEPELILEEEPVPTKTAPTETEKMPEPVAEVVESAKPEPVLDLEEPTEERPRAVGTTTVAGKGELLGPPDWLLVPSGTPAWATTTKYRVKRGDTAYDIARRIRQDKSVSLEQVVLALYENNRNAFFDNNTNNLRAGKILKIPERDFVAKRSKKAARREFLAQYDTWQEYKLKVASSSKPVTLAEAPVAKAETKPTAKPKPAKPEPKIARKPAAKKVPESAKATPARKGMELPPSRNGRKEELLRIVRANVDNKGATAGKSAETESKKGKQPLTEKAATLQSSQKAAKTPADATKAGKPQTAPAANQRLASIESQDLARPGKPAAKTGTKTPVKKTAPKLQAKKPLQVAKPAKNKRVIAPPPPAKEEGIMDMVTGIIDEILGNQLFLMLIAAVVVLGGGVGLIYARRRKKSLSEFEESILTSGDLNTSEISTDSQDVSGDASDTSFLSDFSQGGMGNIATDEVDPIAEADVYLAYGRDEQAEEILKDAIVKHPDRHELKEKLLEIYSQRGDVGAFETLAEELYAALEGKGGELWERVAGMGSTLNPGNPMFQGGAPAPSVAPQAEPTPTVTPTEAAAPAMMGETGSLGMDTPLEMTEEESITARQMGAVEQTQAIDLSEMQAEAMAPEIDMGGDLDLSPTAPGEPEIIPDEELGGLEFNLDIGTPTQEPESGAEPEPEVELEQEAETDSGTDAGLTFGGGETLEFEPSGVSLAGEEVAESSPTVEESDIDAGEFSLEGVEGSGGLSMDEEDEFASLRENNLANNEADLSISIDTGEGSSEFTQEDLDTSLEIGNIDTMEDSGSELDLSMGDNGAEDLAIAVAPEVEEVGGGEGGSAEQWDEAATKLDLAKAYIDMGDAEGAKSILEEVATEGNDDQKRQAAELAEQIA
jgi:pilus assembly protein FimV